MIKAASKPCLTLTCDDCDDECWEEGMPHFDSIEQARKYAGDEWLFTDDEQICPDCRAKRLCDAEGHQWGEWWSAPKYPLAVYRSCQRDHCGALDYTVAAP